MRFFLDEVELAPQRHSGPTHHRIQRLIKSAYTYSEENQERKLRAGKGELSTIDSEADVVQWEKVAVHVGKDHVSANC